MMKEADSMEAPDWQELFMQIFTTSNRLRAEEPDQNSLNRQFMEGDEFVQVRIGELLVTTGALETGDPLCYLGTRYSCPLERRIAAGRYPVDLALLYHPVYGYTYLAARLLVTDSIPVRYETAMPVGYGPEDYNKPGVLAGFGVDTGLACICDRKAALAFVDFLTAFRAENPDKNIYDDYFKERFAESDAKAPRYQREGGDYLDWTVPGSQENILMFRSGFGDGFYSSYWGYDESDELCCLVVRLADPAAFEGIPLPVQTGKNYRLKPQSLRNLVDSPLFAIATDRIVVDGCRVGYMYREEPRDKQDSGWLFFEGTESQEYLDQSGNMGLYRLNTIANYDPSVLPFIDAPAGSAFYRDENGDFKRER